MVKTEKQMAEQLQKRLINPSREFDSLFWRPKSKFMRRIKAGYINMIVGGGYFFLAVLAAAVIYLWSVKHDIVVECTSTQKLVPDVALVQAPDSGVVTEVLVVGGDRVEKDQVLGGFQTPGTEAAAALRAPIAGHVYLGSEDADSLTAGQAVVKKTVLFRVVDFDNFAIKDVALTKGYDSVSIGDSAVFLPVKSSGAPFEANFVFRDDARRPVAGQVILGSRAGFAKELQSAIAGDTVIARGFGAFPVASAKKVVVRVTGRVVASQDSARFHLNFGKSKRQVRGAVVDGYRVLKVAKVSGFQPEVQEVLDRYLRSDVVGATAVLEGRTYSVVDSGARIALEAEIEARLPLSEPYDITRRPKGYENDTKTSDQVVTDLRFATVPPWISHQAKLLYESSPRQFLEGKVRVTSHRTTWGRRLLTSMET